METVYPFQEPSSDLWTFGVQGDPHCMWEAFFCCFSYVGNGSLMVLMVETVIMIILLDLITD